MFEINCRNFIKNDFLSKNCVQHVNSFTTYLDAHGWKSRKGCTWNFMFKSLGTGGGVMLFRQNIKVIHNFVCFAFLLTSFSKMCLGRLLCHTPTLTTYPSPTHPPKYASMYGMTWSVGSAYLKLIFMWRESGSNLFDSNMFHDGLILVPNEFVF